MTLNPLDIQQKTFRAAIRGYAEDEVDDFLDEVVITIREYEQKLADLTDEANGLRERLEENREAEEALRRTFIAAQRTADEITEEAKRDAERVISDARADAARMTMEQGREKNQLMDELARLREIAADVKGRLSEIADDVNSRIDDVATDIDDAEASYGRWEDDYGRPSRSAIADLRDDEDVDDGDAPVLGTDDGDEFDDVPSYGRHSAPSSADGDPIGEEGDEDDDAEELEVAVGALDDDSEGLLDEDVSDDFDDTDSDDDEPADEDEDDDESTEYAESGSVSSARRPWERYDD